MGREVRNARDERPREKGSQRFGPGLIVAAAFIGPGTVTTASVAGARYGVDLLWAVVFSVIASVVLQEMAARLGLVSGAGLGQALRTSFGTAWGRAGALGIVLVGIGVGNTAFEVGNVTGAALGIAELTDTPQPAAVILVAFCALGLLASGRYHSIERWLGALVVAMALLFVVTAALTHPDGASILKGALWPAFPQGSLFTVIALIGTTVVPYNLFLHASAAAHKWRDCPPEAALRSARIDAAVSIALGGAVTASIIITAAAVHSPGTEIGTAAAMARQLEPALGAGAEVSFLLGLLAAGVTSAAAAPLAASYATGGCLGWADNLRDRRMRAVWLVVLAVGTVLAVLGRNPLAVIVSAQALNGLLLPLIALFLLLAVNQRKLLGPFRNGHWANLVAGGVVCLTLALGAAQLLRGCASM